jgi:hypothetical protein
VRFFMGLLCEFFQKKLTTTVKSTAPGVSFSLSGQFLEEAVNDLIGRGFSCRLRSFCVS